MSSNQDDFIEQTDSQSHQANSFPVNNQLISPNNYGSFQVHPGATSVHQGQAPMDEISGRFPYPSMQQFGMDPGTGRLPVPSGYPANALPGNMGRFSHPAMFQSNNVTQMCPTQPTLENVQLQPGLVPVSAAIQTSDTSDSFQSQPSQTSDSLYYSSVQQYPNHNNNSSNSNNNNEEQQLTFPAYSNGCEGQQIPSVQPIYPQSVPGPCFEGHAMSIGPTFQNNGNQQFSNTSQMLQESCPPGYSDFVFNQQQQQQQHQITSGPSPRPLMGPKTMNPLRQPVPAMNPNPNVFLGEVNSCQNIRQIPSSNEDWQQQQIQQPQQITSSNANVPSQFPNQPESMTRMQHAQKTDNYGQIMQAQNIYAQQSARYPQAQMMSSQQNWRANNIPNTFPNVQNSLPNVSENYSDCFAQPQSSQQIVPNLAEQSATQFMQANSQSGQASASISDTEILNENTAPEETKISSVFNSQSQTEQNNDNIQNNINGAASQIPHCHSIVSDSFTTNNSLELQDSTKGFQYDTQMINSNRDTSSDENSATTYSSTMTVFESQNVVKNCENEIAGSVPQSNLPIPTITNGTQAKVTQLQGNVGVRPHQLFKPSPPVMLPPGMMPANQARPISGIMQPRIVNPHGMQLVPRVPGMVPIRGPAIGNFNSLSSDDKSSFSNVPATNAAQQQRVQVVTASMMPPGATMPMIISGSMPSVSQEKVSVPWGWKRVFLGDQIVYFSPSGIQLKSSTEIKEYLLTEGTCKCGLDCPVSLDTAFNFDPQKLSDLSPPNSIPVKNTGCKHVNDTLAIAQIQNTTGFAVRHNHNPIFSKGKDSLKKTIKKKKKPFSGVLVSQMLAAREAEKQRIVEIIAQQKAEHEASLQQASSSKEDAQMKSQTNKNNTTMQKNSQIDAGAVSETSIKDMNAKNLDSNPLMQESEKPSALSSTAPHLAKRMVHPALLHGSKMMNLGSAAQRFGSENLVLSPKNISRRSSLEGTPTASQEAQRPYSLAEAMQAARKLNLEQTNKDFTESSNSKQNLVHEADDINSSSENMAAKSSDEESTVDEEVDETTALSEDVETLNSQGKIDDGSDTAKNIEIRRLSNTDEGNKVLEPSFHSPEKQEKKNPLQNIFNIVSGMELPLPSKINEDEKEGKINNNFQGGNFGMIRPQLKGRKRGQYSTLPALPHSPPPWVLGGPQAAQMQNMQMQNIRAGRAMIPSEQVQMAGPPPQFIPTVNPTIQVSGSPAIIPSGAPPMLVAGPPQMQIIQTPVGAGQAIQAPAAGVQPMYQMVQTVNGTMLVQMQSPSVAVDNNFVQIQPSPQTFVNQSSPSSSGSSSKSSSPGSSSNESPTSKKKGRKRKIAATPQSVVPPQPAQQPILVSPSGNIIQTVQNNVGTVATSSGQFVAISQFPQAGNVIGQSIAPPVVQPNMIINPGGGQQMILTNGTLMSVPQNQGIMYQQLPDGSIVQVANQMPLIQPAGQQLVAAPPLQGQVMVNGPGQIVQGNAPQLILTPQGLMQAVAPMGGIQNINTLAPNLNQGTHMKRSKEKKKSNTKRKEKSSSDTSVDFDNNDNEGYVERDSVDETDTSFEEPQPSTSKEFSPKSSIQSNQVDSSGLNATPPYQKDGEYEQLRSGSELDSSLPDLDLDISMETSRNSRLSGFSTPSSNLSVLEDKISECDSDLDHPLESPKLPRVVSSTKDKKKKKKKKKRSHASSNSLKLGDLVWGPVNGYPSWPGKIVSQDEDKTKVWVCWFVTRQVTQIDLRKLKSLSEGLEDHHRERKNSRRGKKMNLSLEKAIQEAMSELD